MEECGLQVEVAGLDDVYFFDDDPRGNGIMIVYRCQVTGGELTETTEAVNPTYFRHDEIPDRVSGAGHDRAIPAWQRRAQTRGAGV